MKEPEINYWYPHEWDEEYRRTGTVNDGVMNTHVYSMNQGIPNPSPDGTLSNLSTYALTYLPDAMKPLSRSRIFDSRRKRKQSTTAEKHSKNTFVPGWEMDSLRNSGQQSAKRTSL